MSKNKSFEFEATMKQLEKIVSTLESESESLEKSLTLFEEGMKLSQSLRDHLDSAEQRISVLRKDLEGNVKTEKSVD